MLEVDIMPVLESTPPTGAMMLAQCRPDAIRMYRKSKLVQSLVRVSGLHPTFEQLRVLQVQVLIPGEERSHVARESQRVQCGQQV